MVIRNPACVRYGKQRLKGVTKTDVGVRDKENYRKERGVDVRVPSRCLRVFPGFAARKNGNTFAN